MAASHQLVSSTEIAKDIDSTQYTVPSILTKVYKDECMYCFNTPFFEGGVYVCLKSFYCVCTKHVAFYSSRFGHKLFVQIESRKVSVSMDTDDTGEPNNKITKLAVNEESNAVNSTKNLYKNLDFQKFEIEDAYHLTVYPKLNTRCLIDENLGEELYKAANFVVSSTSAERLEMLSSSSNAWDGEERKITKHANLEQLNNGKKIPYSGWMCDVEGCGLSQNLWLNLVDGSIRCGRSQFISEGTKSKGNNHMKLHYDTTGYPLVVKLGTILKDGTGDVYSYDEDDAVIDPNLSKHLAHFGLDVEQLEKTEKSTIELELDMNQEWEWVKCQEDGVELENIFGGGYTGLINIGSSCYMNSVLQALLMIPSFQRRYVDDIESSLLTVDPQKIPSDFNAQFTKLFSSMMSGDYAVEDGPRNGISPKVFKRIAAGNHSEFSTARQQDAEEYIRFLFDRISSHTSNEKEDPTMSFKFLLETRFEDLGSGCVRYTDKDEYILGLPVRKDHLTAFTGDDNVERYRTQLTSLIESELSPSLIEDFTSPVSLEQKGATNTVKFRTFPDFLLLAVQRFYFTDTYVPKKYDVDVEVDDELDLSAFRGAGKKDEENLLPDILDELPKAELPPYNTTVVEQLEQMGFSRNASVKAAIQIHPSGSADAALEWLMGKLDDPSLNDEPQPVLRQPSKNPGLDRPCVQELMNFGFTGHQACYALEKFPDPNAAAEWLFLHADEVPSPPEESVSAAPKERECLDGNGKYKLIGLISHMGSSPQSGHYVTHLLKDDKWILINDEKVAISQNPPKQLAYLYLYQRI
ncbi:unnamed protein product [Auanema sp. JU1783]|nr:unnamed protein product [Auanema sp. JU1783]